MERGPEVIALAEERVTAALQTPVEALPRPRRRSKRYAHLKRFLASAALFCAASAWAGSIRGTVHLEGTAPTAPVQVTRDQKVCGQSQADESLVVGKGQALANVVVFLEDAPAAPPGPGPELTLDQVGCRFTPHVMATRVGSGLTAVNSDPLLHTVHGTLGEHTPFNQAMPLVGMKKRFVLSEPGIIKATCDAGHAWMSAWIHVFTHSYFAVTGSDGAFELKDVPPGRYALVAWQERLGTTKRSVAVKPDAPATVSLSFKSP
jgi:hypothetical protein